MTDFHSPSTRAHEFSLLHLELRKTTQETNDIKYNSTSLGLQDKWPSKEPKLYSYMLLYRAQPGGVNGLLWSFKTLRSDYLDHLRRFGLIVGVLKNQRAFAECIEKQENAR